jgi:hypothetical protein
VRCAANSVARAPRRDASLIAAEISLIGDLISLQYRKKFPVPDA